jgi:hypothetical protein
MLFRRSNGELININKYDFKNDKLYYEKIMQVKISFTKTSSLTKLEKTFNNKNN